jgi:hypothetical protein
MNTDERIDLANQLYERAVWGGDVSALRSADRELDKVEADLSLARGRIIHARFLDEEVDDPQELVLFERALQLYQALGDARGESESLFWVGIFHQVVREDNDAAVPLFTRSYELATQVGDKLTLSYVLRHRGARRWAIRHGARATRGVGAASPGAWALARGRREPGWTRLHRGSGWPP